jgi:SAM-dependent methyltransferase
MPGVGLDFSELMLEVARKRLANDQYIELMEHDLASAAAPLGRFEAVVSSFAVHYLEHERKRSLCGEVFDLLEPGGVFASFEMALLIGVKPVEAALAAVPVDDMFAEGDHCRRVVTDEEDR